MLNIVCHTHINTAQKRHKANKSWESWFRRQRGTSRTVILCDCSLLCTSKWHITVPVVRMAAGCLEFNRHIFFSLNNWAAPSSEAQVPQRPSMWVTSVLSWSEAPRCIWVKGYPRVHFGDVCRVRALTLEKAAQKRPVYGPISQVTTLSQSRSDTVGVCEHSLGDLSHDEMLVISQQYPDSTVVQ